MGSAITRRLAKADERKLGSLLKKF